MAEVNESVAAGKERSVSEERCDAENLETS